MVRSQMGMECVCAFTAYVHRVCEYHELLIDSLRGARRRA